MTVYDQVERFPARAAGPIECEVLVIGGGATGVGVARDAALRGLSTVLAERHDLATGTTGRFHGLLHSGGRYVVKDPNTARECYTENVVLRQIAADCIEDTGGLFVTTPIDDPGYADRFTAACSSTGIPAEEIEVAEALRREPRLNPRISRAFVVPDATADAWKTVWACARSAAEHGATILPYHEVVAITRDGPRVTGALLKNRSGEESVVRAQVVVNAAGAWAGQIAALAGCRVNVLPAKGIMVAANHRLVQTVVNRCNMPADGDALVPIRTVSVIGTTDVSIDDPDNWRITRAEIEQMLAAGENLVPGFRETRMLRVWGGVRPLYQDAPAAESRDVTRAHAVLDHNDRDGVERLLTITGGKFCTFRLMASDAVDAACAMLGVQRSCRTADEPLPDSADRHFYWVGSRLDKREKSLHADQLICECELVTRGRLREAIAQRGPTSLDDIRRVLRLGMGPCQGGFCMLRATGIMHEDMKLSAAQANQLLLEFLQERWKGVAPLLHGDQLRQAWLDDWIYQGVLDVAHLPRGPASAMPGSGTSGRLTADGGVGAPDAGERSARSRTTAPRKTATKQVAFPVTRTGADRPGTDVIVIGAGLAGLVAAVRLAEEGLRVVVVARGHGSLRLAPATLDILGYAPGLVGNPSAALPEFTADHPDHPYRHVSADLLAESTAWLKEHTGDCAYVGDPRTNMLLATAVGVPRPSAIVPQTMAAGDLRSARSVLIAGFGVMKDFQPWLVAENLSAVQGPHAVRARAVMLEIPAAGEADLSPLALARRLENPEFRRAVVTELRAALGSEEALGLPAVLGVTSASSLWTEIQEAVGRPVFEIPTIPPSVPGIRLAEVLSGRLRRAGGRLVLGAEAAGARGSDGLLAGVRVRAAARESLRAAGWVVLASGGLASGGVEVSFGGEVRESVLGLPLWGGPAGPDPPFGSGYFDDHPMSTVGLRTDARLRPLGPDGYPVFDNVRAAGAVLGGARPWREKSGDGISLTTGYLAAGTIIEEASS